MATKAASPASNYPQRVKVKNLKRTNALYDAYSDAYIQLRLLYNGGVDLERAAAKFLTPRAKEPNEVYQERLRLFTIGSAGALATGLSWYVAALFKREPKLDVFKADANGNATQNKIAGADQDAFERFVKNVDRRRTKFHDYLTNVFEDLALYGVNYTLIDMPNPPAPLPNRMVERELGYDNPKLVRFLPENVIDWEDDDDGNLLWIKVQSSKVASSPAGDDGAKVTECWYIWDTQYYAVYERPVDGNSNEDDFATLVKSDRHPLSLRGENRVPVRRTVVKDAHWFGNRCYLQTKDLINESNGIKWKTTMGNYAMPVVYTSRPNFEVQGSEAGYVLLGTEDRLEWAEPDGKTIQISQERAVEMRENIFRSMHLIQQGRDSKATPAAQSGVAKEADMMPSQDVAEAFGDKIRECGEALLNDWGTITDRKVVSAITGYEFNSGRVDEKIERAMLVVESDMGSPTLEKTVLIDAALEVVQDKDQAVKDKIVAEIEAAPTKEEQAAQEAQNASDFVTQQLQKINASGQKELAKNAAEEEDSQVA